MLSLQIQMHSFQFKNGLFNSGDTVRVSITTLPDGQKQSTTFEAKKMSFAHPSFVINFSEVTEKIIIVFRKNSFTATNRLIASTVIESNEFAGMFRNMNDVEMKKINIYEPLQHMNKNNNKKDSLRPRRVFGKMELQLSLCEKFDRQNYNVNSQVNNQIVAKGFPKRKEYLNENVGQDSLLFCDLITN